MTAARTDDRPPVALVTGATSGIGEATARTLSESGWSVIICGRREDRLRELAASLPTPTHALALDLRDHGAIDEAVASVPAQFQPIDLLVNSAGLGLGLDRADEADPAEWLVMIETNVTGLALMTRAVLPMMVAAGSGQVVNIGSISATWPYPGSNVYGATKAFVRQFTLNLRADLLEQNIRATVIDPGMTQTEFAEVRFRGDRQAAGRTYSGLTPLAAQDIARAVLWVAQQPPHVNINIIELMPTCQSFAGLTVVRDPDS